MSDPSLRFTRHPATTEPFIGLEATTSGPQTPSTRPKETPMTQHVRDALDDQGRPPAHLRCEDCSGYGRFAALGPEIVCADCEGTGTRRRPPTAPTAGARPRTAQVDVRGDNGASEGGVA